MPSVELHVERGADDLDDLAGLLLGGGNHVYSVAGRTAVCVRGYRLLRNQKTQMVGGVDQLQLHRLVLGHRAEQRRRDIGARVRLATAPPSPSTSPPPPPRRRRAAATVCGIVGLPAGHALRAGTCSSFAGRPCSADQPEHRPDRQRQLREPVDREPHPLGQVRRTPAPGPSSRPCRSPSPASSRRRATTSSSEAKVSLRRSTAWRVLRIAPAGLAGVISAPRRRRSVR